MITTKKELEFYIHEDAKRNNISRGWWFYVLALMSGYESAYVFRYLKQLRRCEWHFNNRTNVCHQVMYFLGHIRLKRLGLKIGLHIPLNTCGYGLRIIHLAGGCILNAKKVGNYCGFNGGSLLGNKDTQEARPVLGDFVALGPGAKVIGNVTIGDNVFVAPNAVVVKDVPSNVIVAGVPAKVIKERQIPQSPVHKYVVAAGR